MGRNKHKCVVEDFNVKNVDRVTRIRCASNGKGHKLTEWIPGKKLASRIIWLNKLQINSKALSKFSMFRPLL